MIIKEKLVNEVYKRLSILKNYIESNNANNLYDSNIYCEDVLCGVLNIIYKLELQNLNSHQYNYPAVDLGDFNESVCFQITTSNKKRKIKDTVDKFINHKLYEKFEELNILIIGEKIAYKDDVDTKGYFNFSIKNNVKDYRDLCKDIYGLRTNRIEKTLNYLEENLNFDLNNRSYLSNIVHNKCIRPNNFNSYIAYLGEDLNTKEVAEAIKDLNNFMNDLEQLDRNTREVVFAVIKKNNSLDWSGIYFNFNEVGKYLNINRENYFNELRILNQRGYISTSDDNGTEYDRLEYYTAEYEVFSALVNFCTRMNRDIKKIIVDLDFRELD